MAILEELQKIVAQKARCSEQDIDIGTTLSDLHIDSLDWVQIIVAMESTYDIEIDVDRMREFGTIWDFVKYVEKSIA